ncbi:MAG: hypothetical protein HY738_12430 [Bacteroidia bacterium]|nr:hypothetical protein [Bacteroidia bacterium]
MPKKPIRVKVIIMDNENYQEAGLSDIGDYLEQLEDYEEVLAKGQVKQFKRQYNGQS